MAAQYSIPFCAALSLYYDPKDPQSFTNKRISDEKILAAMRKGSSAHRTTKSKKRDGTARPG